MTRPATSLRYLDAETVRRALPTPLELVDLAELALRSLVAGAEVPAKVALGASSSGAFAHAMPARLSAAEVPGGGAGGDLLGLKWIAGRPGVRPAGQAALSSLIVLNDPASGMPCAVMDGDVITGARTAALSGVAVRLLGPLPGTVPAPRALIVGAGVQGRAHAAMLDALLPGVELVIHDRHAERAEALARAAAAMVGVAGTRVVADPVAAARQADVVISVTALAGTGAVLGRQDVGPDALVLPVDYGAWVKAELVSGAATFVVDDRAVFEANRRSGRLSGWPDPVATLGELLLAPNSGPRPRSRGLVVALHQGPGIADVIVADAVLRGALAEGLGIDLPR